MSEYNLNGLNFLIVDDNKHMRSMIRTILNALGCSQVQDALDGAQALATLRDFHADMIITDWKMRPMDGLEFTRKVRMDADSPNPFVPIIMLTGHTEMTKVVEARDVGVSEYLAKPVSAKLLYERIKNIIERPRPFVRTETYFGPDRRRRQDPNYSGPERRQSQPEAEDMSDEEIQALLNG